MFTCWFSYFYSHDNGCIKKGRGPTEVAYSMICTSPRCLCYTTDFLKGNQPVPHTPSLSSLSLKLDPIHHLMADGSVAALSGCYHWSEQWSVCQCVSVLLLQLSINLSRQLPRLLCPDTSLGRCSRGGTLMSPCTEVWMSLGSCVNEIQPNRH